MIPARDQQKPIILASHSPRRRELLAQIGLTYSWEPSDVNEQVLPGEAPEVYAQRVARDKALVASRRCGRGVVIAADTIVVHDNRILGKPSDRIDALHMLTGLSGAVHRVITGMTVMDVENRESIDRIVTTKVWFRQLDAAEITAYVDSGEPFDKAGAYGIQGRGALLVERIEGCYFNVVGLPLSVLGECLAAFHVPLW